MVSQHSLHIMGRTRPTFESVVLFLKISNPNFISIILQLAQLCLKCLFIELVACVLGFAFFSFPHSFSIVFFLESGCLMGNQRPKV